MTVRAGVALVFVCVGIGVVGALTGLYLTDVCGSAPGGIDDTDIAGVAGVGAFIRPPPRAMR